MQKTSLAPLAAALLLTAAIAAGQNAAQARKAFKPTLPLFFEQNEGQLDQRAGFLARMPNATLYLTGADAVLVHKQKAKDKASALRMHWVGASRATAPVGEAAMAAKSNYFVGNDQSLWHTGVTNFQRVRQSELYPGVDLVYYGNRQQLEYDLTVQPGASPANIRLRIEGAASVAIDQSTGDLVLKDAVDSPLRLLKPLVYQNGAQQKTSIPARYLLSAHNTVSFALGDYDHSRPLIIDPEVIYSTVFGGTETTTGSSSTNLYAGMTVDSKGFVYLSGLTGGFNLPATMGAYQTTCDATAVGCASFFIAKFDPTQSGAASLIYATYIGGTTDATYYYTNPGNNLAVDLNGDAYIVGHVFAADNTADPAYGNGQTNFPITSNAFATACTSPSGSSCPLGFLTEINPAGSQLLYSTWLEPTFISSPVSGMEYPAMVAVDSNQIAYVAGSGGGGSSYNFLAAYNTTLSGAASQIYAVGFGFKATSLAVDPTGIAYVGGTTLYGGEILSTALTDGVDGTQVINLNGAGTTTPSGDLPAILVAFNTAGQNTYATLLGTNSSDLVTGVSCDPNGIAYVAGTGTNIVQVNGLASGSGTGILGAFIAQFNTTQTGPASLLYSTYINAADNWISGGNGNGGVAVSSNGSGLFAFSGESPNAVRYSTYPLVNPLVEPNLFPNGQENSFVGIIDPSKSGQNALIFLSFIDGADQAWSLFFASAPGNNLFVAGTAYAPGAGSPFLSVPASYLTALTPAEDSEPLFFYEIALGPIDSLSTSPSYLAFPSEDENTTSPPLSFNVTNTSNSSVSISSVTPSAQFNESDNCAGSLPAGQSCTVQVTFEPTALSTSASPTTGSISLNVAGASAPLSQYVSGIGVSASTGTGFFVPQSIAFGTVPTGTSSAAVSVKLTNSSGSATIFPESEGINATNFPVGFTLVSSTCGTTLSPGASCTFSVAFAPTASTNSYNGSNSYAATVYASAVSSISFTGTASPAAPIATFSATTLTFPSTALGTSSNLPVTLTNTGSASLTGISVGTPTGANPTSYTVGGSCSSIGTLAVGANCTISVTFAPQALGSLTAMVNIMDNATSSPQTVSFSGTGVAQTAVSPASLSFGSVAEGATSADQTVTLTNNLSTTLTIDSVTPSANYSVYAPGTTCGTTLGANSMCTIAVTFKPTATGSLPGSLTISTSAANSPNIVSLSGTGTAPTGTPSVVSVTPNPATGLSNTFVLKYADTAGHASLKYVGAIFNPGTLTTNSCYVLYYPATNLLYLENNGAGTTNITPGSGTLSNSQCSISGTGTSVVKSGDKLTLNLAVTASSTYTGKQTIFMYAEDASLANTGWVDKGTWTPAANEAPTVVSVTPNPATGVSNTFVLRYSDPNGASDLDVVEVDFGAAVSASNSCFVSYYPATNLLALLDDAGTAGTKITPGTGTLSNSQCTISGSGTTVVRSGDTLKLSLAVTAASSYTGAKDIFMSAEDNSAAKTGYVNKGTWTP